MLLITISLFCLVFVKSGVILQCETLGDVY